MRIRPSKFVQSVDGVALQQKLWEELMVQLEIIQPGVSKGF